MIRHRFNGARPSELSAFEKLIYPIASDAFMANIWQRNIVHFEGGDDPATQIISPDEYLNALFEAGLGAPKLFYTNPSHPDPEAAMDSFSRVKATWETPPTLDELAHSIAGGTLVFFDINVRIASVNAWCQRIFEKTGWFVGVNAYFGASADASAFDLHFDNHDAFVIQVAGKKDWLLWETPEPSNVVAPVECKQPLGEPDQIVRMDVGDVLYVPKRRWHWPKTVKGGPSLHLTFSARSIQPKELIGWLKHVLAEHALEDKTLETACEATGALSPGEGLERAIAVLRSELSSPDAKKRAELHATMKRMKVQFGK